MKIKPKNYVHGGWSLEIVAETDAELMILEQIWSHGEFDRGDGSSITYNGCSTGYYLKPEKKDKDHDK